MKNKLNKAQEKRFDEKDEMVSSWGSDKNENLKAITVYVDEVKQHLADELSRERSKMVEEMYKAAAELDKHNSKALFPGMKDIIKPEAYMYLKKIIATSLKNK